MYVCACVPTVLPYACGLDVHLNHFLVCGGGCVWSYLHVCMLSSLISQETVGQLMRLKNRKQETVLKDPGLCLQDYSHITQYSVVKKRVSPVHITVMLGSRSSPTV